VSRHLDKYRRGGHKKPKGVSGFAYLKRWVYWRKLPEIDDSCWQQSSACIRVTDFGGSTAQDWALVAALQWIATEGGLRYGNVFGEQIQQELNRAAPRVDRPRGTAADWCWSSARS